jgi:hypothetical protein
MPHTRLDPIILRMSMATRRPRCPRMDHSRPLSTSLLSPSRPNGAPARTGAGAADPDRVRGGRGTRYGAAPGRPLTSSAGGLARLVRLAAGLRSSQL